MSILLKYSLIILILFFNLSFLCAQYSISGQLIDSEQKYERIALELVPSINGLTSSSMSNVINTVEIDSAGHFTLEGNDLPNEPMLYRLSVQTTGEGIGISNGKWKNHIHLVLKSNSQLLLEGCEDLSKTFGFCEVKGDKESMVLQELYDDILHQFWDDYRDLYENDSETKRELVYQRHINLLKNYCDTSNYFLPALVAYKHIKTELDDGYNSESNFYSSFLNKIMDMKPNSPYALELKKELYIDVNILHGKKDTAISTLDWILGLLALSFGFYAFFLRRQLSDLRRTQSKEVSIEGKLNALSKKEIEVFQHIKDGKSNKEIASILFIEVNTVKSHISKIYQKLDIKSRKEALEIG